MSIIKSEYIRRKLSYLKSIVEDDTKQKLYDFNKTAEDIFMHLLNDIYGWQLVNANDIKANFPAIDLIDTYKEIAIQVTSSMDDAKVVSTIEKFAKFSDDKYKDGVYKQYADYDLKMFYIKEKPDKFTKATQTKIDSQDMSDDDFLGIEDINTKVSANPNIAQKVFKTLCKLLHDKACEINKISEFDKKLYSEFLSDLPTSGAISFIYKLDFHYIFKFDDLSELFHFCTKWDSAEYEFMNKDLEMKRFKFYEKLDIFLYELNIASEPIDDKGTQSIIPKKHRIGIKPQYLLESVEKINNLSREVYKLHQEFIRLGKEYVYS